MSLDYHLGSVAKFRIAPLASGVKIRPADIAFIDFCLHEDLKIGSKSSATVDFKNFCTGGATIKIPVGDEGVLEFSGLVYIGGDASLQILQDSRNHVLDKEEVWLEVYPEGKITGKPFDAVQFTVTDYIKDISVVNIIKLDVKVMPRGKPVAGVAT